MRGAGAQIGGVLTRGYMRVQQQADRNGNLRSRRRYKKGGCCLISYFRAPILASLCLPRLFVNDDKKYS